MKDFTISPVSDVIGAEVVGLDVSEPLDGETVATLRQVFQDHHLVFSRSGSHRRAIDGVLDAVWAARDLPRRGHDQGRDRSLSRSQCLARGRTLAGR